MQQHQLNIPSPTSPCSSNTSPCSSPRSLRKRRQYVDWEDSDENLCPPKSPCQSPCVSPLESPRTASPAPAFDFNWHSVLPALTISPPLHNDPMDVGSLIVSPPSPTQQRLRQDSVDSGVTWSTQSRENSFDSISTWFRSREGSYDAATDWIRSRQGSCDSNDSGFGFNRHVPDPNYLHAYFGMEQRSRSASFQSSNSGSPRASIDFQTMDSNTSDDLTHLQIARNKLALSLPPGGPRTERRRSSCKEITLTLFPRCIEEEELLPSQQNVQQPLFETVESRRRFSLGQTSPENSSSPKSPDSPRPRPYLTRSLSADTPHQNQQQSNLQMDENLSDSLSDLSPATIQDLTRRAERRGAVCYTNYDSALASLRHLSVDCNEQQQPLCFDDT